MKPLHLVWALLAVSLGGPGIAGCAHGGASGGALILATPEYELHFKEGRVLVVKDEQPGEGLTVREVESYQEFRDLYTARAKTQLPPSQPAEGVEVKGWGGMDCVRRGSLCADDVTQPLPESTAVKVLIRLPARGR